MRPAGVLAKGNRPDPFPFFVVRDYARNSLIRMDEFYPEFEVPACATGLRLFGWLAVLGAGATPVVLMDFEKFYPGSPVVFWFSIFLTAMLPAFMAAVAFGLATIVENTARTAWELRIRRR